MAREDGDEHPEEGSMSEDQGKVVTLRSVGNRTIGEEPEMQRLRALVSEEMTDEERERTAAYFTGQDAEGGYPYGWH